MLELEIDVRLRRGDFSSELAVAINEPVSGIFGPSGSGKTTLLHCLSGLLRPDSGCIALNGEVLFDSAKRQFVPPHRRHIGMVFQDAQLFPHLSVENNLLFGYRRLNKSQRHFELGPVVDMLEIGELLHRRPNQLSGGQQQRVALGRALLYSPQLLLLDEPLAALDQRLKRQILPFLRRVRDEAGIPMLYVSHALDEILYLSPILALVGSGKVLGYGHYLDVFAQTHDASTEGSEIRNFFKVTLLENHPEQAFSLARLGEEPLVIPPAPAKPGQLLNVSVQANQIALSRQFVEGITIQNQLPGQILRIIPRQHGALVEVGMGEKVIAEVSGRTLDRLGLAVGERVYCLIKAQSFEFPDSE